MNAQNKISFHDCIVIKGVSVCDSSIPVPMFAYH